jgi:cytochrome c-type biogenesis protein CcmH/NrfG
MFNPQGEVVTDDLSDDAIITRFEPLLEHGPRNIKILTTLAQAYARKLMFDKSLSFYQRALQIGGAKRADIEQAGAETMLKKIDFELSQLDPKSPDFAAQCERIQNQRLESQWQEMEKVR